ncbi:hypothetical protein KUTeg_018541 [Tegillarca granosa]|uniref:DUF3456 domain-containing protein n=1 Tax=Tegillarca granosa TaxID=220873 RepID=A0ABQ9EI56_TEGGR|nr:hypothetical protein KUTeg_018541 [Tegillarca granosa]
MELQLISFIVCLLLFICDAKRDTDLYCAVCRAMVDEVNYAISKVDPKKKVQVGSFRVDSKGNQDTYQVPYARSEVHLTELLESICDKFNSDYALSKNKLGKTSVARTASRDGKGLMLQDITINQDNQKLMKFANVEDIEAIICNEISELCTEEDLQVPLPITEMGSKETVDTGENRDTSSTAGGDGYATQKKPDGKIVSEKSNKEEL